MMRDHTQQRSARVRQGFTLVEVMAMLLIAILGLISVTGLFLYASESAKKAQVASSAMITAISVAYDDSPWLDPSVAGTWTVTGTLPNLSATGWVNGYWVTRAETGLPADVIATDPASVPVANVVVMRSTRVDVVVRFTPGGNPVASFSTRLIRQAHQ
jgi:type II secretory pathway pseudopilin PulG